MRCLAALLAMCSTVVLAAPAPAGVNLSFQQSDAITGKPSGWVVNGDGYDVRSECTPSCALHVQRRDVGADRIGVFQQVKAGSAAGHRVIFSGRIRTAQADGAANLYLQAKSGAASVAEGFAVSSKPTGTSDWKHFEVEMRVPANADNLTIAVGMVGAGSAWFDSLDLKVDESVTVAAVVPPPPPPVPPPRPVSSQLLLDDAALRLAKADMPDVKPAWSADVRARVHPLRSLFSDDFSDLQFLKPLLAGKRIVQLGESSHGAAEMNWMKVRLIKFLHQEMGFDVLAVESSLPECELAERMVGKAPAAEVQTRCMMWTWRTREVLPLFDYLEATRKTASPLTLAGFDTQLVHSDDPATGAALRALLPAALGDQLAGYDAQLKPGAPVSADTAQRMLAFYAEATAALQGRSGPEIDFQRQVLRSREVYVRQQAFLDGGKGRDAGMAENINYLLDRRYPKRKMIVWAHNAHVANGHPGIPAQTMGAWLAAQRKAEMYTIGLYMGRGVHTNNFGQWEAMPPPAADSLDGVLANAGLRYSLVDFSGAKRSPSASWMFAPIDMREFATQKLRLTPAESYDAVIYIDTITPALH